MNLNDILHALVQEYGREVLRERARVLGLVADRHPTHKREHRLLKVLYEADIVEELLRDGGDHAQRRAVRKLVDEFVVDAGAAEEAVQAVCMALGYSVAETKSPSVLSSAPHTSTTLIDGRYQDHGDGTVTDTITGLQWMRCLLGQTWNGVTGVCMANEYACEYTWKEALAAAKWCRFAGYQDWRVPSIGELNSIIEKRRNSFINLAVFPEKGSYVWAASISDDVPFFTRYVNFGDGETYFSDLSGSRNVRLVRDGQ